MMQIIDLGQSERAWMPFPIHGWMLGEARYLPLVDDLTSPVIIALFRWFRMECFLTRILFLKIVGCWLARLAKPGFSVDKVAQRLNLGTVSLCHLFRVLILVLDNLNQIFYVQIKTRTQHDDNIHYAHIDIHLRYHGGAL